MAQRSTSLSLCGEWFRVIKYSSQWDRRRKIARINSIHFLIWKRKQTPLVIKAQWLQEKTINSFSMCFQKKIFNDVAIQHRALCQLRDVNDRCLILMVLPNKLGYEGYKADVHKAEGERGGKCLFTLPWVKKKSVKVSNGWHRASAGKKSSKNER